MQTITSNVQLIRFLSKNRSEKSVFENRPEKFSSVKNNRQVVFPFYSLTGFYTSTGFISFSVFYPYRFLYPSRFYALSGLYLQLLYNSGFYTYQPHPGTHSNACPQLLPHF